MATITTRSGKGSPLTNTELDENFVNLNTAKLEVGANAVSASQLATARTIALGGDVSGSASFNGSADVTITATVADDSHNHVISNVDGLQAALDGKAATSHTHTTTQITGFAEAVQDLIGADIVAGTGLSVSYNDTTGDTTITNTAPDQVVALTGTGATSVSGTYPNFTISSTDTNTTYTAGAGLTLTGTTFSHTDTSSQASVNNSGAVFVQDVTLDGFGHVTALGSVTVTPALIGAAAASHTHSIANVTGLQTALDAKASITYVDTAVANLVDTAPATLDTLNELAAALGDDPNFATTVSTQIGTKVDNTDSRLTDAREWSAATISQAEAEAGTATTRRAFTAERIRQAILGWWNGSADKTKLDGIAAGAQVNVATNLSVTGGTTAGPTINSSTGTNVVIPSASATASGVVTTGAQTFAGVKTFSSTITGSVSGNAGTATTLQTARTINGTSFNGSANITTANWGTARTLTVGSTGKSVNGSGNVSWSLAEIGALPLTGGTLSGPLTVQQASSSAQLKLERTATSTGSAWIGADNTLFRVFDSAFATRFSVPLAGGAAQVNGNTVLDAGNYNSYAPTLTGGGASGTWGISITGSSASTTGNAATATTLQTARTINGTSFNGSANITTANWGTARTLTIGNTGKSVNGSANVSWSLAEIGALPLTGGTVSGNLTVTGDIYGRSVNGQYSSLYRMGGIYFTWDSDSYGTNFDHSITSTNNGVYSDSITINSYSNVRINIDSNGNSTSTFSIGRHTTGTANTLLTLDESGNLTTTGNVTAYSDIRLKEDLEPISDALAKVQSLTGYTYTRIDSGERQTGVVAQDVQKVLPEAVNDTGEHLSIAYGNMVGLLIEAIKEQQKQIDDLKARLEV